MPHPTNEPLVAPRPARPRSLNLFRLRFPVGAMCSFAHRVSGVLLALFLPVAIYALRRSLDGQSGYAAITGLLSSSAARALVVLFLWALAQHVLAGARHLLMDIDVGSSLTVARRSAWSVNLLGLALALLALGAIW